MNNISSQPVEDGRIDQEWQIPSQGKELCLEYEEQQQRCPAAPTPPVLDVSAQGGPEGVTPIPTELKMRSGMIAFSVELFSLSSKSKFTTISQICAS